MIKKISSLCRTTFICISSSIVYVVEIQFYYNVIKRLNPKPQHEGRFFEEENDVCTTFMSGWIKTQVVTIQLYDITTFLNCSEYI